MNLLQRARRLLRRDKTREPETTVGSYVMDISWVRSEELRPERLGPSQDDIDDPERVRVERWRPRRTLGPYR